MSVVIPNDSSDCRWSSYKVLVSSVMIDRVYRRWMSNDRQESYKENEEFQKRR